MPKWSVSLTVLLEYLKQLAESDPDNGRPANLWAPSGPDFDKLERLMIKFKSSKAVPN